MNTETLGKRRTRSAMVFGLLRLHVHRRHPRALRCRRAGPGANIRKKFGWKLSHFTLRTLEIVRRLRVSPAMSNCSASPSLRLSSSMYSVDTDTSGLPASSRREPLAGGDLVVAAELFRPGDVLVAIGELAAAWRRELDVVDRLAVDVRHARTDHRPRARMLRAALFEELRELLVLVRRDVDEEEVRRVRRQAAPPVVQQVVAHHREQQQHHDAERERRELHHAFGAPPAEIGDAVTPGHADTAAKAGS